MAISFTFCEKPKELYYQPMPEEGFYLVGEAIGIDSVNLESLLKSTSVLNADSLQVPREGFYSMFIFISSSNQGFSVKQQSGDQLFNWGGSLALVEGETNVWKASLIKEGANLTVDADGLYYLAIDMNLSELFLFKIDSWILDGSSVVNSGTNLPQTSTTPDSTVWFNDEVSLQTGYLKLKFHQFDLYSISGDSVNIMTYIGKNLSVPVYGGDSVKLMFDEISNYQIKIKYDKVAGYSGKNNLPPYDPRIHTYSLIGSAFYQDNDPNNPPTAWNVDFWLDFDTNSDTLNGIYNFKYNAMNFISGGEFKIRLDGIWNNGEFGYKQVNYITGDVENITDAGGNYGNFKVVNDAVYDVTFTFDAVTFETTVDFSPLKK